MDVGQAVIAAGFGLKSGAAAAAILAALQAALAREGVEPFAVGMMATPAGKASEPGMVQAATRLALPLHAIDNASLKDAGSRCLTRSARSLRAVGVGSAAEAAALAALGPTARLLGPRLIAGHVTCALASDGNRP